MFAMGMTRNRQADRDRKVHEAAVRRAVARQQVQISPNFGKIWEHLWEDESRLEVERAHFLARVELEILAKVI